MANQFNVPFTSDDYNNPTAVSGANPTFGDTDKFNIPSTIQPFDFQQQRGETGEFLQDFSGFLGSQETLPQIQARYENRFDIPNLQEQYLREGELLGTVGSQIRGIPESVAGRTRESMVTESQRGRIVNKELEPLLEAYQNIGTAQGQTGQRLAMAESNLNNAAKLELAQQQKMTTPWLQAYDSMNIMQAREFSGYTFAEQTELQRLLANQQSGLSWTNAESDRAHRLSMLEKSFQNSLTYLEKQNEFALDLWS